MFFTLKNKMRKEGKKGISPVVAVVLLVLITFLAIGIIWAFIKPLVEGGLEEGGSCFELRDHAKILESEFTCYNETDSTTKIMIQRNFQKIEVGGFKVSIFSEGTSKTFDITSKNPDNVEMLSGGIFTTAIEIPEPGEARTYRFSIEGNRAELGVITTAERICSLGSYKIPEC